MKTIYQLKYEMIYQQSLCVLRKNIQHGPSFRIKSDYNKMFSVGISSSNVTS